MGLALPHLLTGKCFFTGPSSEEPVGVAFPSPDSPQQRFRDVSGKWKVSVCEGTCSIEVLQGRKMDLINGHGSEEPC